MTPRLLRSELTGQVYVVTRYTEKPHPTMPDRLLFIAHRKYDVTEDFNNLALATVRRRRRVRRDSKGGRTT